MEEEIRKDFLELVRLMDGTLEAVSAPGGGIAFVLRVPQQVIDPRPLHQ